MADEGVIQRVIKRFRPGSGPKAEAISIIDTNGNRAPNPGGFRPDLAGFTDESNYPMAASNLTFKGEAPLPTGTLPGVKQCDCWGPCTNTKHGIIPSYSPDSPQILNRLFGLTIQDDE